MKVSVMFVQCLCVFFFFPAVLLSATEKEVYEADMIPWSGYWWPSRLGGMHTGVGYRGHPTVLQKLGGISSSQSAAVTSWYVQNFFKPDGEAWFGLCHAWALAAAHEPEPTRGGVFRGVPLGVGDKKAFLTLAHTHDVTYRGNGYDPLVFHQWILRFLKENRKPFVVNLGTDREVWFYPAYRAEVSKADFTDRTEFDTLLWYAANGVFPDYVGILPAVTRQTYTLYKNSEGQYTRGIWTGDSVSDYPRALWSSLERKGPAGFDMEAVIAAVRTETDDLSTGFLRPGAFSAFAEGTWSGNLDAMAGEWLEVEFSLPNRQASLSVSISDGILLLSETVSQANPRIRYLTRRANPTLTITADPQLGAIPYTLRYDLARTPLATMTRRDANLLWTGLAGVPNLPAGESGSLLLTARARNGSPLRSETLPVTGNSKFSHLVNLPDFDIWAFGRAEHFEVTVGKTLPFGLVGLSANISGLNAFSTPPAHGRHAVYGRFSNKGNAVAFYVRNHEAREVNGTIEAWEGEGTGWLGAANRVVNTSVTLAPRELRFFSWGAPPLPYLRVPGQFAIDFGSARVSLEACFVDRSSSEMVPAAGEFGREFLLSHYPNAEGWGTTLHILNPWATTVEVGIETADGRRLRTVFVPPRRLVEIETASLPVTGQTLHVRSDVSMAAHACYQAIGGDWAMLPLSRPDQTRTEILVPHLPDAPWWAGVILDNANAGPCEVTLEYFGASGEMLNSERRVLDAYEPWVFTAARSPEKVYLKVRSSAPLGCGVLYGSDDLSAVAGYTP